MAVDSCPQLAISCDRVLPSAVMSSAYHLKTTGFLCKKNTKWEGRGEECGSMWSEGLGRYSIKDILISINTKSEARNESKILMLKCSKRNYLKTLVGVLVIVICLLFEIWDVGFLFLRHSLGY